LAKGATKTAKRNLYRELQLQKQEEHRAERRKGAAEKKRLDKQKLAAAEAAAGERKRHVRTRRHSSSEEEENASPEPPASSPSASDSSTESEKESSTDSEEESAASAAASRKRKSSSSKKSSSRRAKKPRRKLSPVRSVRGLGALVNSAWEQAGAASASASAFTHAFRSERKGANASAFLWDEDKPLPRDVARKALEKQYQNEAEVKLIQIENIRGGRNIPPVQRKRIKIFYSQLFARFDLDRYSDTFRNRERTFIRRFDVWYDKFFDFYCLPDIANTFPAKGPFAVARV